MRFRLYEPQDFNEVATLFAQDLGEYPLYAAARSWFDTKAEYMAFVRWMTEVFLRVQLKYNRVLLGVEKGRIIAAAVIAAPYDDKPRKRDFAVSAGLQTFLPTKLSNILAFREMLIRAEDFNCTIDKEEHWHLYMLAVKKEYRGRGVGSLFVTKYLIPFVGKNGGKYISLAAYSPENVRFYERAGFEVLHRDKVKFNSHVIPNWCMGRAIDG